MVDMLDLGSGEISRGGSSPSNCKYVFDFCVVFYMLDFL